MSTYNQNAGYGKAVLDMVSNQIPVFGNIFVVKNPTDTSDNNYERLQNIMPPDSSGIVRFYTDLLSAYNACQSDNNDVILLDGHTSHKLTTGLTVAKNRVHFLGMDSGDRLIDQGAKVEVIGSTDTSGFVLFNTGLRNTFRNIKFIQSCTNAAALAVVQDGAEGAVWKNCSFIFAVNNNLGGTTANEFVAGSDSATYLNCTFGSDTLLTTAARTVMLIKSLSGFEFKSNQLKDCTFIISSSSATATFVRLNTVNDILFTNLFNHCNFQASIDSAGGIALTAGAIQTGTGTVKGTINLAYPCVFNCGLSLATSGNNAAVLAVAPASVATAVKGIQPTA